MSRPLRLRRLLGRRRGRHCGLNASQVQGPFPSLAHLHWSTVARDRPGDRNASSQVHGQRLDSRAAHGPSSALVCLRMHGRSLVATLRRLHEFTPGCVGGCWLGASAFWGLEVYNCAARRRDAGTVAHLAMTDACRATLRDEAVRLGRTVVEGLPVRRVRRRRG